MIVAGDLAELYRQACELELQAFKPGNVSVYSDGHDMTVADFRDSYQASAMPLCNPDYSLGEKIYYAVKATREAVACNTNLGIILLCAPLIEAAYQLEPNQTLRHALDQVLSETTQTDANWVFMAISLAAPGGLGTTEQQDVREEASVTLTEAMRLASDKDRIALQYISCYRDIFDFSLFVYYNGRNRWNDWKWAAVAIYASLLSQFPDSHVQRKYGDQFNNLLAVKMTLLSNELADTNNPDNLLPLLYSLDQELKANGVNPGTSADLTVAAVFTALLEELIRKSS